MKYYLIASILLISNFAIASCPIDENATACSIATFQQPTPMQNTYTQQSNIKEYSDTPETRLKPAQNDRPSRNLRDFGPQPADYSYNTSCLFGICNPTGTPELFKNRR